MRFYERIEKRSIDLTFDNDVAELLIELAWHDLA